MRDILHVASPPPAAQRNRALTTTPHHIGVMVANEYIGYGQIIREAHHGYVLHCLKKQIFRAVTDCIAQHSKPA
ncbi:MAG TPA: hypothetical protein VIR04_00485 [Paralcaligenes sp.]